MQVSTNSKNMAPQPIFSDLIIFFSRLFLGRKTYIIFLLLILMLLSGHLTMPANLIAYDNEKQKEAQDILDIAGTYVDAYKVPEEARAIPTSHEKLQVINEQTHFWTQLQRQSNLLVQSYGVMQRYNREPPESLGKDWHNLYNTILEGLKQHTITEESDVVLRIGLVQLIEDDIYNKARNSLGLGASELRPTYSRTQYWRNILSGSHYFSILPLVALMLLLHSSFSIDYESGSAKIINSLPVGSIKRNAARLTAQGILAAVLVALIVYLCSFTYPPGEETVFLQRHGSLLQLERYLTIDVPYFEYVILSGSYFLQGGKIYSLILLFFCFVTMLLSACSKNSLLALFLPLTFVLINYMPNYMQSRLGKDPQTLTALLSPQMVIEGKASLPSDALECVYLICVLALIWGILFSVRQGRRSHVD